MLNKKPFLYFDIETGDKTADTSSILSISYARGSERQSLYAKPSGSISDWALKNVWEPIRQRIGGDPSSSEEDVLKHFLGVLESHKGGTIAGWNIGYVAAAQTKGTKGFDIPFIMSRAEKYGLSNQFQQAFQGVSIRDIGREHSVRIAQEVAKYPDIVDPKLFAQARSFTKLVDINAAVQRLHTTPEIAEWMGTPGKYGGYELAGWKLKDVYHSLFGEHFSGHHLSDQDVEATRRIAEEGNLSRLSGPEYVRSWNTTALLNKAEASARAREMGGLGSKFSSRAGAVFGENAWLRRGAEIVGEHKVAFGVGVGLAALFALKPLSLFSGKDDAYNTIEGLRHGGQAEKKRHQMTDFGSGWIRRALSMGIEVEKVAVASTLLGKEMKVIASEEGSRWLVGRELGRGGMGAVSEAFEAGTGKAGIYKSVGDVQRFDEGVVVESPAFKHMSGRGGDTGIFPAYKESFMEKYTVPASKAWRSSAEKLGGGVGAKQEAALQNIARNTYGDIVPEVYGTTKTGIFMESAGRPLKQSEEVGALKWLQKEWKEQLNRVPGPGESGIMHLDPQIKNIMKKGKRYQLIDWGVATTEPLSRDAKAQAIKAYEGYIKSRKVLLKSHKNAVIMSSAFAKNAGKGHIMSNSKLIATKKII